MSTFRPSHNAPHLTLSTLSLLSLILQVLSSPSSVSADLTPDATPSPNPLPHPPGFQAARVIIISISVIVFAVFLLSIFYHLCLIGSFTCGMPSFLAGCLPLFRRRLFSHRQTASEYRRHISSPSQTISPFVPRPRRSDATVLVVPSRQLRPAHNILYAREGQSMPFDDVSTVSSGSPSRTSFPTPPNAVRLKGMKASGERHALLIRAGSIYEHEEDREGDTEACAICLDPLKEGRQAAGSCLHWMHEDCLTGWLGKSIKGECPVCRAPLEVE